MIFTEYLHEKAKNLTGVHLTFCCVIRYKTLNLWPNHMLILLIDSNTHYQNIFRLTAADIVSLMTT